MRKIIPSLWFDGKETVKYYLSIFKNSRITRVARYLAGPGPEGAVMTQAEIDRLWKNLSAGRKEVQCGWLEDGRL